jgi:hypothetical protein
MVRKIFGLGRGGHESEESQARLFTSQGRHYRPVLDIVTVIVMINISSSWLREPTR